MIVGYIIAFFITIGVIILACCKVSGTISRQEEKEHPCETCVRWNECNGIDPECPWRKDHA